MLSSDWSSDVCSSDLYARTAFPAWGATYRYGSAQGGYSVPRGRWHSSARPGHHIGHRRRGHTCRAPLRHAADDPFRHSGYGAGLAGPIQHARRHSRTGGSLAQGTEIVWNRASMSDHHSDLRELYKEVIFYHNRHPRNFHAIADTTPTADGHNHFYGNQYQVYTA